MKEFQNKLAELIHEMLDVALNDAWDIADTEVEDLNTLIDALEDGRVEIVPKVP